jgi:MFS family permease
LLAALFGDRLGRKNTLRVGAAISCIGAILQFSATTFPQFIIGRVINGFGNGLFICVSYTISKLTEDYFTQE